MRGKSDGWGEKQDITAQQGGEELTRDSREWKEIIANSIPDIKEKKNMKASRKRIAINNRNPVHQWLWGRLVPLQ